MIATIQTVETSFIEALQQALPELSVESFPEKPQEYELLHPLGAVLVQYDGSTFGNNRISNGALAQVRTFRVTVTLLVRNLRNSSGCYEALDRAIEALSGLMLPGAIGPVTAVSESFSSEVDGIWIYVQNYEVSTCQVSSKQSKL